MAAKRRRAATVEEHPKGSGLWRVRARSGGRLVTLGSRLSKPAAEALADTHAAEAATSAADPRLTWTQFGLAYFKRRTEQRYRDVPNEKNLWKRYVDTDPLGDLPVSATTRKAAIEWRDRQIAKGHQPQTLRNALNVLRVAARDACDRGLLPANPLADLKLPSQVGSDEAQEDLSGILLPDEQLRVLHHLQDPYHRALVTFLLFSGMRHSELNWLTWGDVRGSVVIVSRSRGGKAPKSKKVRRVELFPPAAVALATAQEHHAKHHPDSEWIWPAEKGGRMSAKIPAWWFDALRHARIERRVVWHDLRHTCATSLLAGWWGRKWQLHEVTKFLGHSSVAVTERYARLLDEGLRDAVAETAVPQVFPELLAPGVDSLALIRSQLGDLNPRPTVYENVLPAPASAQLPPKNEAARDLAGIATAAPIARCAPVPAALQPCTPVGTDACARGTED